MAYWKAIQAGNAVDTIDLRDRLIEAYDILDDLSENLHAESKELLEKVMGLLENLKDANEDAAHLQEENEAAKDLIEGLHYELEDLRRELELSQKMTSSSRS